MIFNTKYNINQRVYSLSVDLTHWGEFTRWYKDFPPTFKVICGKIINIRNWSVDDIHRIFYLYKIDKIPDEEKWEHFIFSDKKVAIENLKKIYNQALTVMKNKNDEKLLDGNNISIKDRKRIEKINQIITCKLDKNNKKYENS